MAAANFYKELGETIERCDFGNPGQIYLWYESQGGEKREKRREKVAKQGSAEQEEEKKGEDHLRKEYTGQGRKKPFNIFFFRMNKK